jgi:hypothetical protein
VRPPKTSEQRAGVEVIDIEIADAMQADVARATAGSDMAGKRACREVEICSALPLTEFFRHEKFEPFEPAPGRWVRTTGRVRFKRGKLLSSEEKQLAHCARLDRFDESDRVASKQRSRLA